MESRLGAAEGWAAFSRVGTRCAGVGELAGSNRGEGFSAMSR
jgi:hypothetical protein